MKANEERYETVTILGKPALFTSLRIERDSVPEGIQQYEVRHEDDNGMKAAQIGLGIMVNHIGTLLMRDTLPLDANGHLDIKDDDLVFTDGDIRSLDAYMKQHPARWIKVDATKETFTEHKLGYSEEEAVLFTTNMVDFLTVPRELQVLYAYEGENEYGLALYEAGKTITVTPFVGSYISIRKEGSLLASSHGTASLCYREIFTGRQEKMSLRDYMRECGLEQPAPGKAKKGPER